MTAPPVRAAAAIFPLLAAFAAGGCSGRDDAADQATGPVRAAIALGPAEPAAPPVATAAARRVRIVLETSETERGTQISLPGDVLFAFDDANIQVDALPTLDALATLIAARRPRTVTIEGHTDGLGDPRYNADLAQRRAGAVRDYLVMVRGTTAAGLGVVGLGARDPVASNRTAAGRARNRRVVVVLAR